MLGNHLLIKRPKLTLLNLGDQSTHKQEKHTDGIDLGKQH